MKKEVLDLERMSDEDVDKHYRRGLRGGAAISSTGLGLGLLNEYQKYGAKKKKRLRKTSLIMTGTGLGLMGLSSYAHYKDKQNRKIKAFTLTQQQTELLQRAKLPQNQQTQIQPTPQQQQTGEVTMKDLQLEQARLRRQQIQIQHQKSQLLLKDEMARKRNVIQLQKLKKEEEDTMVKNSINVKKEERDNNEEAQTRNTSLYKSKPKLVQPVGMPRSKL
jgi:hypothetical protein